jgi:hypothetical protein
MAREMREESDDMKLLRSVCEYVSEERLLDLYQSGLLGRMADQEAFCESVRTLPDRLPLLTPHDAAVLEAVDALTDALADAQRAMDNGEAYTASNHLLRTLYNLNRARRAANAGGEPCR